MKTTEVDFLSEMDELRIQYSMSLFQPLFASGVYSYSWIFCDTP
jgi:hypothetical protein